jgi:hypothetical protein
VLIFQQCQAVSKIGEISNRILFRVASLTAPRETQ